MALLLDAHFFLLPPIKKQRLPPPPTNEYPHPSLSLSLAPPGCLALPEADLAAGDSARPPEQPARADSVAEEARMMH
uniref:Uncharacterized protein n=1 Tax=Oryza nivara TaxID=4536 RepID=A0A0E0HK84_ORYNI